jgi:valyl-tRNA synthetase
MLEPKYNHLEVEKGKYEIWKEKGYFNSGDKSKIPFTIVIPPPNVTGKLHLGHAWDTSIQDVIIRFKRMQGFDTLWLPGMDHAGIATQAKIDAKLKSEGINPRSMERNAWLEKAWQWKEEYANSIHEQWASLGLSLDYSKERFTLDEGLNKAVTRVFIDLYNKGLIYRGERIINWDPVAMTALSNEEVEYKDDQGAFYHIKYMIEGTDEYLDVATTRPETLFGDTAVAVNPNDKRYQKYVGKNVILPIVNKKIPVITDEHADPEFGTGIVKITPAHDPNDFEVGQRHNLERIICLNTDATMNENAGKYEGQDRYVCRENLINDLKETGLLISIEPITHSVGHSQRSGAAVEPYLSKQWFVKMRPLADAVLVNQKNKDTKVNFVPSRFEKVMNHWMEITYDWCISRQLWWGHRIPAWYKGDEIYVGETAPKEEGWVQDEDVLDTWFSSALWPFSTLGWPNATDDFKRYYPNNVLVTGYDIIPFWVNRMTFQGLEFTGNRPFEYCIIHGLVRDAKGRKMSKSLGNGIDPIDEINTYGADALRYYLTTAVTNGLDLKYDQEKLKSTWNFLNKVWNASRFTLMNLEDFQKEDYTLENLTPADKWILTKMEKTIKNVTRYMEKFDLNLAGENLYNFFWTDFCDKFIEMAKFNQNNTTKSVLLTVLTNILKMLHPFAPFITDEIYNYLPIKDAENIQISNYPKYDKKYIFEKEENDIDDMLDFITNFRNKKAELNLKDYEVMTENNCDLANKMLKLTDKIVENSNYNGKVEVEYKAYKYIILYDNSLKEDEKENIIKEKETLEKSIQRRENLLANENYVSKAPANIVSKEKESLEEEQKRLNNILKILENN